MPYKGRERKQYPRQRKSKIQNTALIFHLMPIWLSLLGQIIHARNSSEGLRCSIKTEHVDHKLMKIRIIQQRKRRKTQTFESSFPYSASAERARCITTLVTHHNTSYACYLMIRIWYSFGTHLVCIWTHLVRNLSIWYASGTQLVRIWYA